MSTVQKSDVQWQKELTKQEYEVLRRKGTEARGGEHDKFYPKEGHFVCRGCKIPLYSAQAKVITWYILNCFSNDDNVVRSFVNTVHVLFAAQFNSGCGWPAFDKCYTNAVKTCIDMSAGMKRIEILCNACDGHLGHVFENEGMTDTNERHCVNSVSVQYMKGHMEQDESKVM